MIQQWKVAALELRVVTGWLGALRWSAVAVGLTNLCSKSASTSTMGFSVSALAVSGWVRKVWTRPKVPTDSRLVARLCQMSVLVGFFLWYTVLPLVWMALARDAPCSVPM